MTIDKITDTEIIVKMNKITLLVYLSFVEKFVIKIYLMEKFNNAKVSANIIKFLTLLRDSTIRFFITPNNLLNSCFIFFWYYFKSPFSFLSKIASLLDKGFSYEIELSNSLCSAYGPIGLGTLSPVLHRSSRLCSI